MNRYRVRLTVNTFRPGMLDTTVAQLRAAHDAGEPGTADAAAAVLISRLASNDHGQIRTLRS